MGCLFEGIRTTDPQFECPSALPPELEKKFPLATASRSTIVLLLLLHMYLINQKNNPYLYFFNVSCGIVSAHGAMGHQIDFSWWTH